MLIVWHWKSTEHFAIGFEKERPLKAIPKKTCNWAEKKTYRLTTVTWLKRIHKRNINIEREILKINKYDAWPYDRDDSLPTQCMCEPKYSKSDLTPYFLMCSIWFCFYCCCCCCFCSWFSWLFPIFPPCFYMSCNTHTKTHIYNIHIIVLANSGPFQQFQKHISPVNSFNGSIKWAFIRFITCPPTATLYRQIITSRCHFLRYLMHWHTTNECPLWSN